MPFGRCPFCQIGDLMENLNSDEYFCHYCFKIYAGDVLKKAGWRGYVLRPNPHKQRRNDEQTEV